MNNNDDCLREITRLLQDAIRLIGSLSSTQTPPSAQRPVKFIDKSEWDRLSNMPGSPEYEQKQQWNRLSKTPGTKEYEERQAWIAKQNQPPNVKPEENNASL